MAIGTIQHWMQHPETLDKDSLYELRNLMARYPYFQTVRLLYLKNLFLLRDPSFGEELRRSIIYVSNRLMLFQLIEGDSFALKALKSAAVSQQQPADDVSIDRTLSLINAFLATTPEEAGLTDSIDAGYAVDYTAYLMADEVEGEPAATTPADETQLLKGHDLIDEFIGQAETAEKVPEEAESNDAGLRDLSEIESVMPVDEEGLDETCFTETLAKIYVKQQRYDKALEIIKILSLIYPKKNAYFADQIRFLEKLIINAKFKQ